MLSSLFTSLLGLAAAASALPTTKLSARSANNTAPTAPALAYLFTLYLEDGTLTDLGSTPLGTQVFEPVQGGSFTGPAIEGTVIGGLDIGMQDTNGEFNPNVVALLQTSDGCTILARETGHSPNVFLTFETACSAYNYLNYVVAYGYVARVDTEEVSVEVWQGDLTDFLSRL
ncbi:hypothetical protein M406DRAFT_70325, partial [Cryphonectria parasitica EP155]